ncbi:MAG: ribonuclease R [Cytophagales bacterium]|nr:ribonuclease R [Cytophagales bacterium]
MKTKITTAQEPAGLLSEFKGTVLGHQGGHGFVQRDDGGADVYLAMNEMRAVLHGDSVLVRIQRLDRKGRPEGHVLDILARPERPIIGRLLNEGGVWVVAPEDKRYGQDILIPKLTKAQADEWTGKVVVIALTEKPALFAQPIGKITEVLGAADDPGMEIEIAVRKFDVPHLFSEACLKAAKALPDKVLAKDKKGRVDLTDVPLVTIDGEDARDFDDAVYAEPAVIGKGKKPNGWRLLVAIADVSHYVETGAAIDIDAYERATSVYFPRRVIPMLPEKLSNGLCSLNPEVERLCMVCDMLITNEGELHAYQFYPAVMFSHARFTYNEVAAILTNTKGLEANKRNAQNPVLVPHLEHLHDVYRALLAARNVRGAVDFDTVETQIICDENGRIERIVPRKRNDAHRLIEECMLAANVCSADFIAQSHNPGLFRVHEGPTPEKKEILRNYLKAIGVMATLSAEPIPAEFQAIANATKERPDAAQIHTMLLRSMQQAIYTPINSGHFGLAFQAYTHFTSPIRRYPDLLVHRVIKATLNATTYQLPNLPTPTQAHTKLNQWMAKRKPLQGTSDKPSSNVGKKLSKQQLADQEAWQAAGLHCSACERRADEASRDVEQWLKCKYVKQHLGEELTGVVSTVTSFGLFVTLDQMFVEGLIHITELGGEYYRFDEARQELRGERTGIRYAAGTPVRVQVAGVDLDARKIDFKLLKDEQAGESKIKTLPNDNFEARPAREKIQGKAKAKGKGKASFVRASPVTTRPKSGKSRKK